MINYSELNFKLNNVYFDEVSEIKQTVNQEGTSSLRNILVDSSVTDWANLGTEYRKNVQVYNNQMILFAKYIRALCFHNNVPGLIVHGMPGLGKTYQVLSQLKYISEHNSDVTFEYFKGKITSTQLYINTYLHKNSVLVFDDCDNVFEDIPCMNLLKAMTDTYEHRIVSYVSPTIQAAGAPDQFEFKGKVIIITNQDIESNPHINALTSRMLPVTVEISPEAVIAKSIDNILNNPLYDRKDAIKVAKFIWNNIPVFDIPTYSLRTSSQLLQIYQLMDYNWDDFIGYSSKFLKQYNWDKLKVTSFSQKRCLNFDDGTGSLNYVVLSETRNVKYVKVDCSHPKIDSFTYYAVLVYAKEGLFKKQLYTNDTYIVINNNSGNQYIISDIHGEKPKIKMRANKSVDYSTIMDELLNNSSDIAVEFDTNKIEGAIEYLAGALANFVSDGKLK